MDFQDKDVELMFIADKIESVTRHNLNVKLSKKYNRLQLPAEQEKAIEEIWSKRMAENPLLWNGTKFRLDSIDNVDGKVTFNIGITGYRDFLGTNWSPDVSFLHELGIQQTGKSQAFLSDALGVGALVISSDNKMILMRRSKHCGEAVGLLDIPGGHPEPKVTLQHDFYARSPRFPRLAMHA